MQLTFKNVNIIIQVERLDTRPPPSLNEMMGNESFHYVEVITNSMLKTGVGIYDDIKKLLEYMMVDEVHGIVDIVYDILECGYIKGRCQTHGTQGSEDESSVPD